MRRKRLKRSMSLFDLRQHSGSSSSQQLRQPTNRCQNRLIATSPASRAQAPISTYGPALAARRQSHLSGGSDELGEQ